MSVPATESWNPTSTLSCETRMSMCERLDWVVRDNEDELLAPAQPIERQALIGLPTRIPSSRAVAQEHDA